MHAGRTTRLLLIGCSFAGLELIFGLARRRLTRIAAGRTPFLPGELTIVDPRSCHAYVPLSHEAISGARARDELYFDAATFARAMGAEWLVGDVAALEPEHHTAIMSDGTTLRFARAVIAVGSLVGAPREMGYGAVRAKYVENAIDLRDRVRSARRILLGAGRRVHVVVIGAGITGVEWGAELAGAGVDGEAVSVTLLGNDARFLTELDERVASRVARILDGMGVQRRLGSVVSRFDGEGLTLTGGERIDADVVVWAGGARPSPLLRTFDLPLTANGAVAVTPYLGVLGHEGLFAIGDAARVTDDDGQTWPTMQRAIEAIWEGGYLARRLHRAWKSGAGPRHRLRRHFPYGISLGANHSLVLYRGWSIDSRFNVRVRRWLQRAYYLRFRLLAYVVRAMQRRD